MTKAEAKEFLEKYKTVVHSQEAIDALADMSEVEIISSYTAPKITANGTTTVEAKDITPKPESGTDWDGMAKVEVEVDVPLQDEKVADDIKANGDYEFTPTQSNDESYIAMKKVKVKVDLPLQDSVTATITKDGDTTITHSEEYIAMKSVTIHTDVMNNLYVVAVKQSPAEGEDPISFHSDLNDISTYHFDASDRETRAVIYKEKFAGEDEYNNWATLKSLRSGNNIYQSLGLGDGYTRSYNGSSWTNWAKSQE